MGAGLDSEGAMNVNLNHINWIFHICLRSRDVKFHIIGFFFFTDDAFIFLMHWKKDKGNLIMP